MPRIWIGNRSLVSTHFDLSDNIACVVAGRRRFTLFPPEQLPNLYVGPLDHTMAGQPASMVELNAPDFERFPRFREALAAAVTAELEPGDAIYIPTLWWHQIEALAPFNILVNYWWEDAPPDTRLDVRGDGPCHLRGGTLPPEHRARRPGSTIMSSAPTATAAHLAPKIAYPAEHRRRASSCAILARAERLACASAFRQFLTAERSAAATGANIRAGRGPARSDCRSPRNKRADARGGA